MENSIKLRNELLEEYKMTALDADNYFAAAICKYLNPEVKIFKKKPQEQDILEVVRSHYDLPLYRESENGGHKYERFGLMWNIFGEEIMESESLAQLFDYTFVEEIDKETSSKIYSPISNVFSIISSRKKYLFPTADMPYYDMLSNVDLALEILSKMVASYKASAKEEALFTLALERSSKYDHILELDSFMPCNDYVNCINESVDYYDKIFFVIFKIDNGSYSSISIKDMDGNPYCTFPETWRGLERYGLEIETGIPNLISCDKKGGYLISKNKEAAVAACNKAVEIKEERLR